MKNKGQLFKLLFGLILVGVILALVIPFFFESQEDIGNLVSAHAASLKIDIDQDDIVDQLDKSPCVAGEDIIIGSDGIQYYVFGDIITDETGTVRDCDKNYYQYFYPDLIDSNGNALFELEKKTDANTGNPVCIMPKDVCDDRRYKAYKAWEERELK